MKITSNTAGSWFPTGFYGHHRMKNRADFLNDYRQLAKPQPPDEFIRRCSQPISSHVFSRHDNRLLFHTDVTSFGQGMGRKKHPDRSESLMSSAAWSSYRDNHNSEYPLTSTYRQHFKLEEPNVQMLVKRPLTSFDGVSTTTYRTVHGTDSPNHHLLNAMSNDTLMLSLQSRQHQAKQKKKDPQDNVASCMSWYKPILPPVVCQPDFNHICLQKTGIQTSNCLNTSNTSAVPDE